MTFNWPWHLPWSTDPPETMSLKVELLCTILHEGEKYNFACRLQLWAWLILTLAYWHSSMFWSYFIEIANIWIILQADFLDLLTYIIFWVFYIMSYLSHLKTCLRWYIFFRTQDQLFFSYQVWASFIFLKENDTWIFKKYIVSFCSSYSIQSSFMII